MKGHQPAGQPAGAAGGCTWALASPGQNTQHTAHEHSRRPSSRPLPHRSDTLLEGRPEKTGLQHLFTDLEKKFDAIAELIRPPKNS